MKMERHSEKMLRNTEQFNNEQILSLLEKLKIENELSEDELTSIYLNITNSTTLQPLQNPTVPYTSEDFVWGPQINSAGPLTNSADPMNNSSGPHISTEPHSTSTHRNDGSTEPQTNSTNPTETSPGPKISTHHNGSLTKPHSNSSHLKNLSTDPKTEPHSIDSLTEPHTKSAQPTKSSSGPHSSSTHLKTEPHSSTGPHSKLTHLKTEPHSIDSLTEPHSNSTNPPQTSSPGPITEPHSSWGPTDPATNLRILVKYLAYLKQKREAGRSFSPLFLKNLTISVYFCGTQFGDDSPQYSKSSAQNSHWGFDNSSWCNEDWVGLGKEVLGSLCEVLGYRGLRDMLNGVDSAINSTTTEYLTPILQRLCEVLNKDTWRSYPALTMTYWVTLHHLDRRSLGDNLSYLLPPALFILDDWEPKHQILGLKCLSHILNNAIGAELRWYGRSSVIFAALKPKLYSREPEILALVYPAIAKTSEIIEREPGTLGLYSKETCYDIVLDNLLRDMGFEQKLSLRAVYATVLPQILSGMGILALRWSNDLLNVCADYLSTFDGPQAMDRINILKSMEVYVRECWPRVGADAENILKMIVRLVYDVTLDDSGIDTHSVDLIIEECKAIFKLVNAAAPDTTRELCRGLDSLTFHQRCTNTLHNLMTIIS